MKLSRLATYIERLENDRPTHPDRTTDNSNFDSWHANAPIPPHVERHPQYHLDFEGIERSLME
jgi:hypothetical protein